MPYSKPKRFIKTRLDVLADKVVYVLCENTRRSLATATDEARLTYKADYVKHHIQKVVA